MNSITTIVGRLYVSVAAGFFVWCTSLQFNDPDAALWIAGYAIASVICLLVAFDIRVRHLQRVTLVYSILLGMWMLTLIPEIHGYWWAGEVEREFGGLGITLFSMVLALLLQRHMSRLS